MQLRVAHLLQVDETRGRVEDLVEVVLVGLDLLVIGAHEELGCAKLMKKKKQQVEKYPHTTNTEKFEHWFTLRASASLLGEVEMAVTSAPIALANISAR